MAVLTDENTKVICQSLTGIAADNFKDRAEKIVKAVKG